MFAGVLFLAGGGLFLVGAAYAPFFRVWTAADEVALPIIAAHPRAWRAVNLLMTAGPFIVAVGAVDLVPEMYGVSRVGAAGLALATLAWLPTPTFRLVAAPLAAARLAAGDGLDATQRTIGRWLAMLFGLFTVAAGVSLVLLGAGLVSLGYAPIASWLIVGIGTVTVVGYLVGGDMPPFVVMLGVMAAGVALTVGIPGDPTAG